MQVNSCLRNKRTRGARVRGPPFELLALRAHNCSSNPKAWKPRLLPSPRLPLDTRTERVAQQWSPMSVYCNCLSCPRILPGIRPCKRGQPPPYFHLPNIVSVANCQVLSIKGVCEMFHIPDSSILEDPQEKVGMETE